MNQPDFPKALSSGIAIDVLTPGVAAAAFAHLTANALRPLLLDPALDTEPRGICLMGATDGDRPVGLVVSLRQGDDQDLCSVMVAPSDRRRGIGKALLCAWTARMRTLGRTGVIARWSNALPKADAFFRLIVSCGWPTPMATRHRMTWRVGDCRTGFPQRDALLKRLANNGLSIRSFAETGDDLDRVFLPAARALIAQGRAPDWSDPGGWFAIADHHTSVVIEHAEHGTVGWMLCVRQPELGRWYIPLGWVVEEGIARGWLLGGFASVFRRTEEVHGPDALVFAQPPAHVEGRMGQLLFKHFGRFAMATDHLFESRLDLGAS